MAYTVIYLHVGGYARPTLRYGPIPGCQKLITLQTDYIVKAVASASLH